MKILIKTYEDDYDCKTFHNLVIDGKSCAYIGSCEPEDAIIGRDLIDAHDIVGFMEKAHAAAKNGEDLEIEIKECTSEEFEE